jgi:phosphoserine phosphatase RsbU/P
VASLIVFSPTGQRTHVALDHFPFIIGRQPDCDLVLIDQRISRNHARITNSGDDYFIEDLGSRHGISLNGSKAQREALRGGDIVEFGVDSSYQIQFLTESAAPAEGLGKLKEILAIVRSMEHTVTPEEILGAVVDAALRLTRAERGFLFMRRSGALQMAAARDVLGQPLSEASLRVPRRLIEEALTGRREAFAINFDDQPVDFTQTVMNLQLQSSVFVPLPGADGLLYLDSRADQADLARGNRELLETLALEAANVLQSARRFEEERARRRLEEELVLARTIQENLLPRELPQTGWLRVEGSSRPSRQVGGDYYDVHPLNRECWALSMADVSGKGAGAALLAALLQGALLMAGAAIEEFFAKLNGFLLERTRGEKYATLFYGTLDRNGLLRYANAGHCAPLVVSRDGSRAELDSTGIPVGMVANAKHEIATFQLAPGDKLVVYSDGFTDNASPTGLFDNLEQLNPAQTHRALLQRLNSGEPDDDVTLLVLEYRPGVAAEISAE